MPSYQVICADVLEWAREYKEKIDRGEVEPFHALLCDPPWHLIQYSRGGSMRVPGTGPFGRIKISTKGFMGKDWDGGDVTFQPETWATLAEVLHPGAFLMVFAGSRGWHRLACAMEDAGLVLQPSIFIWLNSQSFPKASRLRKAPKSERARHYRWLGWLGRLGNWLLRKKGKPPKYYLDYVWEGHRYGGQVLKDAATPIIVAQKPWTDPRLDCIVRTGAGAINVDAGRIGTNEDCSRKPSSMNGQKCYGKFAYPIGGQGSSRGRWPSNFCLVHKAPSGPDGEGGCVRAGTKRVNVPRGKHAVASGKGSKSMFDGGKDRPPLGYADPDGMEEIDAWRCEPDCPARRLGEMSGESETKHIEKPSDCGGNTWGGTIQVNRGARGHTDKGTAARYYHQAGWDHERAECADECPVAKLDEQVGERPGGRPITNQCAESTDAVYRKYPGGRSIEGSGRQDSGGPSRFYHNADWTAEIAERLATEDPVRYCPKAAKRERSSGLGDFYWRKDKQSPTGFVRISREEWEALGEEEQRVKAETGKRVSLRAQGNIHVAVKPIALCKWLASLLLPPKEYAPRRIVIPFCGTFREGVGAILAGWEEVVGIDFIQDYCDIAESGIKFWRAKSRLETAQMEMAI